MTPELEKVDPTKVVIRTRGEEPIHVAGPWSEPHTVAELSEDPYVSPVYNEALLACSRLMAEGNFYGRVIVTCAIETEDGQPLRWIDYEVTVPGKRAKT